MQDSSSELSVLVDRSVGGSSLLDGQIELMLHRFLLPLIFNFFFPQITIIFVSWFNLFDIIN